MARFQEIGRVGKIAINYTEVENPQHLPPYIKQTALVCAVHL